MVSVFKNEGITFEVNGNLEHRLPHVLNVSFTGMNIEPFLVNLDLAGIAVSSGSACTAGSIDPSHVLVAMFGKDSIKYVHPYALVLDLEIRKSKLKSGVRNSENREAINTKLAWEVT